MWPVAVVKLHARAYVACIGLLLALSLLAPASAAGAQGWLSSEVLAGKSSSSGADPDVAVDSSGDAFAVWTIRPESTGPPVVEASTKLPGSATWQAPVRLSPTGQRPMLATDPEGDVTAVWEDSIGGESDVEAASRSAGSGLWATPVQLATNAGEFGGAPDVAVDPEGDATAVWVREHAVGDDVIESATKPHNSERWQAPTTVSPEGIGTQAPYVAMDANGDAIAVWQRYEGCFKVESSIRPAASGVWETPVALSGSEPTECAASLRVAVDPQGDAVATWQNSSGGGGSGTVVADLLPASSDVWSGPVALSGPEVHAQEPRVALDGLDEAIVVWQSTHGSEHRIEATTRSQPAGTWQTPVTLSTSSVQEPDIGLFTEVAVNAQGDAVVVWDQSNGSNYEVEATERPAAAGAWQTPSVLSAAGEDAYLPRVAVYPQGDAVAAWEVQAANVTVEAAGYDDTGLMLKALEIPTRAVAGTPVTFSVSPMDLWSPLGTTTWSFGDGVNASGTSVDHTYALPGTYHVALTSANALGDTNSSSASIVVEPAPSPAATRPSISAARMTHKRFAVTRQPTAISATRTPKGTAFLFTLSTMANVRVSIAADMTGLRDGRNCTTPTAKLRRAHAKRCVLVRSVAAIARSNENQGSDSAAFSGRIGKRALAPGKYLATLTASNAGGHSAPVTLAFTVVHSSPNRRNRH